MSVAESLGRIVGKQYKLFPKTDFKEIHSSGVGLRPKPLLLEQAMSFETQSQIQALAATSRGA
jgi:hypothetical protein